MRTSSTPPGALILAGGDGIRLRPLTTQIVSDLRPKQFCSLVDEETLLDRTRRRVDLLVQSRRHLIVVSRPHEAYFRYLAVELAPDRLVIQPANRGTAPGIVYPLLRLTDLMGDTPVAVFPSDHAVSDELVLIGYVRRAVKVVHARRDVIVLLGIEADYPETEYGWIEPCDVPLPIDGEPVFPIRRFWEKPSPPLAQQLFERGCLWNSFIMVGWATAFLELVQATAPDVIGAFEPVRSRLGSVAEGATVERVYSELTLDQLFRLRSRPGARPSCHSAGKRTHVERFGKPRTASRGPTPRRAHAVVALTTRPCALRLRRLRRVGSR